MEKITRAENNLQAKFIEENCANKLYFQPIPPQKIVSPRASPEPLIHSALQDAYLPASTRLLSSSLYRTMCVHKEFTYDECGCVETDKHICIHNLKAPSLSESCSRFRGIEKFKVAGSCETHTMHPRLEAEDAGDEAQQRAGCDVVGFLRRRCSCCMIM